MKLEPIIQSEVSQKEKHQYRILIYIYGIDGETVETVSDYFFLVPKSLQMVTAAIK